jgi:hypothetical protein
MRGLFPLVCCAALILAGCGGGSGDPFPVTNPPGSPPGVTDPPAPAAVTATIAPSAEALAAGTPIVVQFSAPVATASLQLGGTFSTAGATSTWSATNETLTLAPPAGGWPRGQSGTLVVQATGSAGGTMAAPATARYTVPLQLASGLAALSAIGQADLVSSAPSNAARSSSTVGSPQGSVAVEADGRIWVGDFSSNRILSFPAVPATSGAAADIVLGQPDFTTANFPGATQGSFSRPLQVAIGAGRMAAVDLSNSRVLLWSTVPTASNTPPDIVLGQVNFTTSATACTQTGMSFPEAVAITPDGKLLVADTNNQRILVWLAIPTVNGAPADLVIGQSDFTHCRRNDDDQDRTADATPSDRTVWRPSGLWSDGQRLVVVDSSNHRALVWNTFPAASFARADLVLGQATFTRAQRNDDNQDGTDDGAPTARTLNNPTAGVHSNGVQLAITDTNNHRVLVWNTFPTTSFQPADAAIGQADLASGTPGTAADRLNGPAGVTFYRDKLLVSDRDNHRVLVLQSP